MRGQQTASMEKDAMNRDIERRDDGREDSDGMLREAAREDTAGLDALSWAPGYRLPEELLRTLEIAVLPLPQDRQASDGPAGPSLRYSPLFLAIRNAREEDDPTLPRGEWTRTLKRADWHRVIHLCETALKTETKDFQTVAWLSEAWTRLHAVDGVCAALILLNVMIERYWHTAHPSITDGDLEARAGVLTWLRDALTNTLARHCPVTWHGDRAVTLDDWQRLLTSHAPPQDQQGEWPVSRETLIEATQGDAIRRLERLRRAADVALTLLPTIVQRLDAALGAEAIGFERLASAIDALRRASISLIDARVPAQDPFSEADVLPPVHVDSQNDQPDAQTPDTPGAAAQDCPIVDQPTIASTVQENGQENTSPASVKLDTPNGPLFVHNRQHAYQILDAIAIYLGEQEPHSPTPHLLKRAVSWGGMSVVELMRDITSDDGELDRYLKAIGVKY